MVGPHLSAEEVEVEQGRVHGELTPRADAPTESCTGKL